jgi:hypothetical protein
MARRRKKKSRVPGRWAGEKRRGLKKREKEPSSGMMASSRTGKSADDRGVG